ncbi:hypothetical protein EVAR_37224_1 [Eumeta japonica]|uniref:Uncharacterized protein n=1 Tax=Eumeta variegata TaxID=151549 RepID=A0A4C1Y956_EUMVA|nr:hypothetical protein EVAR_37224_1 [Eumeta japonica]
MLPQESNGFVKEFLPGLVPGSSIVSGGNKSPYQGFGSSRPDYARANEDAARCGWPLDCTRACILESLALCILESQLPKYYKIMMYACASVTTPCAT